MNAPLTGPFRQSAALHALVQMRFEATDRCSGQTIKLTAHTLIAHADRYLGEAWPSVETLAFEVGINERGIRRALRELERRGVIERHRPGYKGRRSATYVVRIGQHEFAAGLRKAAPPPSVEPVVRDDEHQVEEPMPASSTRPRAEVDRSRVARSASATHRRRSVLRVDDPSTAPDEALCVLFDAAYSRARESRWGVGTEPIPLSYFAEPLRVVMRVKEATGAGVEEAMQAVATCYVRQKGRDDGRLEELHHPLSWFPYYASRVEVDATKLLLARRAPETEPATAEVEPMCLVDTQAQVAAALAAMGVAA